MIGRVDQKTIRLGRAVGIKIDGGSINKVDGRVRIFVKGKFPGAHKSGYALRSRVVWWLNTGQVLPGSIDAHHKNTVRTDDRFRNLEPKDHVAHSIAHNPKGLAMVGRKCSACGGDFLIDRWRLMDPTRGRFCCQKCYHAYERAPTHVAAISDGLRRAYAEGRR